MNIDWAKELDASITICDKEGVIIYMNDKSIETFQDDGGEKLLNTNLLDCHPEPSRSKLIDLLENKKSNCYSIEKNGIKKLIFQTPFFDNSIYAGFFEISIELPSQMNHFIRG